MAQLESVYTNPLICLELSSQHLAQEIAPAGRSGFSCGLFVPGSANDRVGNVKGDCGQRVGRRIKLQGAFRATRLGQTRRIVTASSTEPRLDSLPS